MNLLLTSTGFYHLYARRAFLDILKRNPSEVSVAIITTASQEWKERNKYAVATMELLNNLHFSKVTYIDIEFEDPRLLEAYDAVFINGGNPIYLLHHLRKSGADAVITRMIKRDIPFVGSSAGAMVLGPDLRIADFFTPEMNSVGMTNFEGLHVIPYITYPHYVPENEDSLLRFEEEFHLKTLRLSDFDVVLIDDNGMRIINK